MSTYRYSQWEDSQELDTEAGWLMEEPGGKQMSSGDLAEALRRMQDEGKLDGRLLKILGIADGEALRDEAISELMKMPGITHILEKAGYVSVEGNRYELSPSGIRKIGQKALEDIFARFKRDPTGRREVRIKGGVAERTEDTKQYEFGDEFQLHLQKTIMNSLYRESGRTPVRLNTEDFEVYKTETLARSVTVLMLDLSESMTKHGNFEAAKQVSIALDSLIRNRYPQDGLFLVGFSSYARQIKKEDLACMNLDESEPYTNLQHGLYIARKLLAKERCSNRQIILVTDGAPNAHFEPEELLLHGKPQKLKLYDKPRSRQLTLDEVRNCTRENIVINIFMLGSSPSLDAFVTQMARINKGRVFTSSADSLGQYLLVDFITNKKKKI